MIWCGCDAGLSGAIAFIHESGLGAHVYPAPLHDVHGQDEVDTLAVGELLETWTPRVVVVEHVNGFGGASSAFKLGASYSAVTGAARWGRFRLELVRPQAWQRAMLPGIHGREELKRASVATAKALFPTVALTRQGRTKPDDFADALLIAAWARSQFPA